jgi:hypothetical protein
LKGIELRETAIKERPILFSAPMIGAILAGNKTQTRRIVKWPSKAIDADEGCTLHETRDGGLWPYADYDGNETPLRCPYGNVGEQLWVRENCKAEALPDGLNGVRYAADNLFVAIDNTQSAADRWCDLYAYGKAKGKNVPSIHMPRWASRINLEVTAVNVQRLQEINEADAIMEGIHKFHGLDLYGHDPKGTPGPMVGGSAVEAFLHLWELINGPGAVNANPWVWVVSFRVIE